MLGIVLGLVLRGFAGGSVPLTGAAAPCEALLGQWKWFTGGVVSINPNGAIVYEGGNDIVAATTPSGGVRFESFTWAGNTVTFGTITH